MSCSEVPYPEIQKIALMLRSHTARHGFCSGFCLLKFDTSEFKILLITGSFLLRSKTETIVNYRMFLRMVWNILETIKQHAREKVNASRQD